MFKKLMIGLILAPFLMAGSCLRQVPEIKQPLYCDVTSAIAAGPGVLRKFTQAEIDARSKLAPWNLRKDYAENLTYARLCSGDET